MQCLFILLGLLDHRNLKNMSFNVSRYEESGLGRLENRWFSFERKILLIIVIFPSGVKYFLFQWDTNLPICVIEYEKFNSIISGRLTENFIPSKLNFAIFQSKFLGISLSIENFLPYPEKFCLFCINFYFRGI